MSRITLLIGLLLSLSAFAQDMSINGFNSRFSLVRNEQGKMTVVKLKKATTRFSVMPFIEQIKQDLLNEQARAFSFLGHEREQEIDQMLSDIGLDPYAKSNGSIEAQKIKEAILNISNINVEKAFRELKREGKFWKEFEAKLQEAFLYIDPSVLANLEDPRFFYKKQVTYKVVVWALEQAQKYYANSVPVLNIASFVIVRVHEMMMEQRHFHHNMLLHYFETIPEAKLGMTKEEVDRTVSSIYEYRIDAIDILSSNAAARDWLNFGMNKFYGQVRSGNTRMSEWKGPLSTVRFDDVKKLNFAFAQAMNKGARHIYHLHLNVHKFSKKPSLAYDYSNPNRVKRNRALLNLASVGLGFVQMPGWLKGNVESFIKSFYVEQVRMEGALVGHFESTGDTKMINSIYAQRANFYIKQ